MYRSNTYNTCYLSVTCRFFIIYSSICCFAINNQEHLPLFQKWFYVINKKNLVVLFAIAASSVYHIYLYKTTESKALKISTAINEYHRSNGKYPSNLSDIATLEQDIQEIGVYYDYSKEVPFLMYKSTFMPFETFMYDFKNKTWQKPAH